MEHLKELRKERGLLQRDVASYLGVDRTTYLKYENGTNEPDIEIIKKLSSFLVCPQTTFSVAKPLLKKKASPLFPAARPILTWNWSGFYVSWILRRRNSG